MCHASLTYELLLRTLISRHCNLKSCNPGLIQRIDDCKEEQWQCVVSAAFCRRPSSRSNPVADIMPDRALLFSCFCELHFIRVIQGFWDMVLPSIPQATLQEKAVFGASGIFSSILLSVPS